MKTLSAKPFWLSMGFWKRYCRSPELRSCAVDSYRLQRQGAAEFESEAEKCFAGFQNHPKGETPLAKKGLAIWKGIFQGRAAPSRICEIGSWQGASAVAFAFLFPKANIICIDTWQGSDTLNMSVNPEELFDANTAPFAGRVEKIKSDSFSGLLSLQSRGEKFDLIYVDGSHFEDDVVVDTILAWRLLNVGGVMIWDDYVWRYPPYGDKLPRAAINWFLRRHRGQLRPLFMGGQAAVEKTTSDYDFAPND